MSSNWLKHIDHFNNPIQVGHYHMTTWISSETLTNGYISFNIPDSCHGKASIYFNSSNTADSGEIELQFNSGRMIQDYKLNTSKYVPVILEQAVVNNQQVCCLEFNSNTPMNLVVVGFFNYPVSINGTEGTVSGTSSMRRISSNNILLEGQDYGTSLPDSGIKGRIFYIELED